MNETNKEKILNSIKENYCLPFSLYSSKEFFNEEKKEIFYNDWVFICHEKEINNSGDYLSMMLVDEPILLKRLKDGSIKAFSNICRHRGTMLEKEGLGNNKKIVCPYHSWTYNDEGKLTGTPFSLKDELSKDEHCLKEFNLEIWKGLVFINLSGKAQALSKKYKEVEKYMDLFSYESCTKAFSQDFHKWDSNWKLAYENGIESYHLFTVHKNTLETITPTKGAFYMEGCEDFTITAGSMNDATYGLKELIFGKSNEKDFYVLISLPPSFIGILTYESLSWISVYPINEEECIVKSAGVNASGSAGGSSEQQFVNEFLQEDKDICELAQKSMKSIYGKGGQLLDAEKIVSNFHSYLGSKLFNLKNTDYHIDKKVYEWFS